MIQPDNRDPSDDLRLAEQQLRERERQLESLMGHLPGLVYRALADEHWTALFASRGVEDLTGYPADDFTSRRLNYGDIMLPEDRSATQEAVFTALRERRMYEVEHRIRHKDGSVRWIWARGHGVFAPDGSLRFIEGLNLDMTRRKQTEEALRETEERFRTLAESLPHLVWTCEPDGTPDYLNARHSEYLGLTLDQLRGRDWRLNLHPEDGTRVYELFTHSIATGERFEAEYRVRRADGAFRWHLARVLPLRDNSGRITKWFGSSVDIDDQKHAAEVLRQAKEEAEAANRAKDEFLANVSHEIRTPMNAIIGMTELVLDTPLDEGQRQGLKTVKSAADSLLSIINDLLDFSKIEAGKVELVPAEFSLREAVGNTLRTLAVRAHKKGLELIYQVQPEVPDALFGDAGRLRQVLLNLVGNAVKFTDEGEVVVTVRSQESGDRSPKSEQPTSLTPDSCLLTPGSVGLRFTVRDTGIGIPPDQQQRIFRAFEQEDTSTTRKYGGTGLGLTIASRLVAMMGGTITVDSAPGRGSTFAFTARFSQQAYPPEPVPSQPLVSLHDLRVLVVDDNTTNRQILAQWLRDWKMESTTVADGMAAMDALWHGAANGQPYPLVLLDARMPNADGLTVASMIRERAELAATRMILLTSGERPGDPARIRELRIDAQLLKPVQQDELLETIYRVMSRPQGNLPRWASSVSHQQVNTTPVPAATPLQILVAEDNELSRQVLEQALVRQGHRVRLASTGGEALALAEQGGFDLLLLDVHMPELDGFQVVQAIRQWESIAGGHLPIIALTARSRKEDREAALAAGMDDFQTKPIRPAELLAAVNRVVGMYPPRRQDLLDAAVLLAACGSDPTLLRKMCQTLTARVPEHLAALRDALHEQDAPRLREAAHKCCGMLSEFSTAAGDLAGNLEDLAGSGQLEKAAPILEQLETMTKEVVQLVEVITVEVLRRQMEDKGEHPRV